MRPAGEAHLAVLQAAHAIKRERAESGQGATLAELVARACVGYKVARMLVPNLTRHKKLCIVGERRVPGRNRPVKEYLPVGDDVTVVNDGRPTLDACLSGWLR